METKTMVVGAVALAAIALAAYILISQPAEAPPQHGNYSNPLGGQNISLEEFAAVLMQAETICLVEDLRGLEKYPISRNNIMQCGVDFAGSEGLAGKELNIYILEENSCSASEWGGNLTTKPLSECYGTLSSVIGKEGKAIIWIEKGSSSLAYREGLRVGVNETYAQGMCNVRFALPAEGEEEQSSANESKGDEEASEEAGISSGADSQRPPSP
ncbi:MAG: hypothetical protein QXH30_02030, partial [Candidatus Bilamarchaeaceae archaeon]